MARFPTKEIVFFCSIHSQFQTQWMWVKYESKRVGLLTMRWRRLRRGGYTYDMKFISKQLRVVGLEGRNRLAAKGFIGKGRNGWIYYLLLTFLCVCKMLFSHPSLISISFLYIFSIVVYFSLHFVLKRVLNNNKTRCLTVHWLFVLAFGFF